MAPSENEFDTPAKVLKPVHLALLFSQTSRITLILRDLSSFILEEHTKNKEIKALEAATLNQEKKPYRQNYSSRQQYAMSTWESTTKTYGSAHF